MKTKFKNLLVISSNVEFKDNLTECLKEHYKIFSMDGILPSFGDFFVEKTIEVVILDLLRYRPTISEKLSVILKSNPHKIIVLENAKELYMNSKVTSPFSVYKKIYPNNRTSQNIVEIEGVIQESTPNSIIFRVAELYGPHIDFGLVHNLMNKKTMTLIDGLRDFIYEGDLIHAIEIALEADAIGIYDIASGEPVNVEKMLELVNQYRDEEIKIKWKREKQEISYNCENFKYYKWEPLITFERGLKTSKKLKENNKG